MSSVVISETETTVEVQVAARPNGAAGGELSGTYPNPSVDVLSMTETKMRYATDGANKGDFNEFTSGSATIAYFSEYSTSPVYFNYARLTTASGVSGSRCWLSDRVGSQQPCILAGQGEMTFAARVKSTRNSQTEYAHKVGFIAGHIDPADPPNEPNVIMFAVYGSGTTWRTVVQRGDVNGPIDSDIYDTGISASDWHDLKVTVNAAGTSCSFYIDGTLVRTFATAAEIPSVTTVSEARSEGGWMFPAVGMRATNATTNTTYMDVDWAYFEISTGR